MRRTESSQQAHPDFEVEKAEIREVGLTCWAALHALWGLWFESNKENQPACVIFSLATLSCLVPRRRPETGSKKAEWEPSQFVGAFKLELAQEA